MSEWVSERTGRSEPNYSICIVFFIKLYFMDLGGGAFFDMKEERKVSLLPVSVEWYVNLTGNVWTSPLPPPPPTPTIHYHPFVV